MSTFVRFDPVFRNLIGTESGIDPAALRAVLREAGVSFVEVATLPGPMDALYVDDTGALAARIALPEESRPADIDSAVAISVPAIPLPPGGVTEPAAGTVLPSGETHVRVRAPGTLDHWFTIRIWTAEDARRELLAYAAHRRWELETAGAPFRGHRVATDDRSKILMMSAVMAAGLTPGWSTRWQFLDGGALKLSGADVTAMSLSVQAYVNGLFGRFAAIKDAIEAGEITTTGEIEHRFDRAI
ncbi:DUF4376 domain-containing protein [Methylorubrum sp. POS3]|uniref:DUF4376 domain-containing protein n=1 Tax=Methylorubrum sp. POS3 TaxID=2998492 RepID=UPI00372B78A6